MKRILIFFILLLSATFLYADAEDEVLESQARNFWDSMASHTDPDLLDECITKYPDTKYGAMALIIRYQLLVKDPSIEGYNKFLEQYPKTIQADYALQNLYDLCRDYNKIPVWMDFLKRHPDTIQGYAAKLHIQTLLAEYVFLSDDEEMFDGYIQMFPDAPQIPGIIEQAAKLAQKQEEEVKAKIEAANSDYFIRENELKKRANKTVNDWGEMYSFLHEETKKVGQDKVMENGDTLVLIVRIRRYERIILNLYGHYDPANQVRAEHRHQELLEKLDSIQQTLLSNHREMVKVIREESEKTRQTLREEFAKLGYKLDAGFNMLGQKMDILHNDLVSVYTELQKVNQNLENIHDAILKSNELLAKIDKDLAETNNLLTDVNKKLVDLDSNMTNQFNNLINEVADFKAQTIGRLDKVIEKQDKAYELQYEQYKVQLETLNVTEEIVNNQKIQIAQNDQLIDYADKQLKSLGRIENNQARQLEQICALRDDVGALRKDVQNVDRSINAMRKEVRDGFNNTNKALATGFAGLQRSLYSINENIKYSTNSINENIARSAKYIVQENRATFQNYQRAMQQAQQPSRQSSGGFGGFLKKLGGTIARVGGAVVGGVIGGPGGAALGGALGNALGTAIEGGNREEIFTSGIEGGISGAIAGSSSEYKPPKSSQMLDYVWDAGKQTLKEEISDQIGKKLPPEAKPLIEGIAKHGIAAEKQKAIKTMAELGLKMEKSDVQNILQGKSMGEVWSEIEKVSRKNGKKPETVRFVMDYYK